MKQSGIGGTETETTIPHNRVITKIFVMLSHITNLQSLEQFSNMTVTVQTEGITQSQSTIATVDNVRIIIIIIMAAPV